MRSAAAKYLAAYIKATGITDTKALSEALGVTMRTIQRHKIEIADATTDVAPSIATIATTAVATTATEATTAVATEATYVVADPPRVYARNESPSGIVIPKRLDTPFVPQDPYAQVWRDENGRLILSDDYRSDWVSRFGGDAARLDLAITQAEGYLQPNNRTKSLDVQLASQLARIVAEKRDRDTRYASAAAANQPAKANGQPSATLAAMDRIKARMASGASA